MRVVVGEPFGDLGVVESIELRNHDQEVWVTLDNGDLIDVSSFFDTKTEGE